ncbi:hypothetical protein EMQ25_04250 [Arsenicitalea aurantiaca]|uniref:Uncharacterized protein n=1 Tax=Arsenicitalea aurantiaca TaxID=1783274 RepID=A0A433XM88_9HYPH|nr:hypothetical protein [Arsenicitalea aurantiaca]RUT35163.1 hypothetical protein EMQ25_04250 [Arsenicitalea aurantiaca]
MASKAALFALLALWGIGGPAALPMAYAQDETVEERADHSPAKRSFTNRVWVMEESGDLPGVIRIFLSDGTLVQDSCWETHRLSPWTSTSETSLSWTEDGAEIKAEILSVSATQLRLQLDLNGTLEEQSYRAAEVPFVCPDMPR